MSKRNKINRLEIFRWKNSDKYAILITRKHTVKVYQNVSKTRALQVNLAAAGTLCNNENHNTSSSICAVFKPYAYRATNTPLTVYFVQIGMDGYLPDSVSAYPTLKQAIAAAIEEKKFILDGSMDSDMKVRGDIRDNWCYEVLREGKYYHTSIRIESDSDPGIHAIDTPYFPLDSRAKLELFCEYYNQNMS